ncbi:suppressor of lurcher protein 1-like isoform X1 [Haliotis rufescens]|uniref:suppressor of lurcher protein 1-like isoform X1 n=1 Tax=Haliotis rufescens TaxID=6454 RepID=UPI001EB06299|nr:suppressor of lurcher protein 1-like isoform X1 [Haliotis rufescens]
MQYWFEGLLIYMSYLMSIGNTVNPGCECVIYQSNGGSTGRFTSPNFPQYYPRDANCILYTFIGDVKELVEITFLQFDMKKATSNNICTDFLRLFLYLDGPGINEHDRHSAELCGVLNSTQKKYYSSDRALILELHADGLPGNFTGFQGRYQFLDKENLSRKELENRQSMLINSPKHEQFVISGTKMHGTQCTYYFDSNNTKSGRLFSPFYPQNYQAMSKCQYHFQAKKGDKVKIFFQNIQLYHTGGSCRYSHDAIVVYNGRDRSADVIGHYCDIQNQVELTSTGRNLFIEFYSDDKNEAQGFAASYTFVGSSIHRSVTTQPKAEPINDLSVSVGVTYQPRPTHPEFNCNKEINSQIHANGTIQSPFHPSPYSAGVTCTYTFTGVGRERVQLKFVHMDLFFNGGNPTEPLDCAGSDSIKVTIPLSGKVVELGVYCGKKLPPVLMSAGTKMTVQFHSESSSKGMTTGFKAVYSFVNNFGISTGERDSRGVCVFNYYSQRESHGTFTSPNYPGLYPRNTECHYLFYGKGKETVHIQFPVFQVEGIGPRCDEGTHSDYVSFSNFADSEDRKLHRLCGASSEGKKESIESDGPFFRVVFKSNDVYDDEGFFAYYQFKGTDNPITPVNNGDDNSGMMHRYDRPSSGSGQRLSTSSLIICLLTLAFLAHKVNH